MLRTETQATKAQVNGIGEAAHCEGLGSIEVC